ncbi:kinase-like domain-containing protein [Lasiosphaeris hirsuta]|uniref:Kinase-like domain-containing protein n=1 Tax=Lasiosphaeris hirsuta TaxID=260670 RepID=A0AA40E4D6_9PEZI|nr:kinase-like domain-containing protein [Lasiosphaeris hirsuta]
MDNLQHQSTAGSSHVGSGDKPSPPPSPRPSPTYTVAPTLPQPPYLPDTVLESDEILNPANLEVIAICGSGYVYRCPAGCAYKMHASRHEFDMMRAAGDCSVRPLSRVLRRTKTGQIRQRGILMELATPFDVQAVAPCDRGAVKDEMVALVDRLHDEYNMVHGDIKPANLVRHRDGTLRFCDFDNARRTIPHDGEQPWDFAGHTSRYLSPRRRLGHESPPTKDDDRYALAASLWELYTGEDPPAHEDDWTVVGPRKPMDLAAVADDDAREYIRLIFEQHSARVATRGATAKRGLCE